MPNKANDLKLEVGKSYRTRNGKKVTVIHIRSENVSCLNRVVSVSEREELYMHSVYGDYSNSNNPADIVSEWEAAPIQVDKVGTYRCRGGEKAYVQTILPPEFMYAAKGWLANGMLTSWTLNGIKCLGYESAYDLVEYIGE